MMHSKKIMLSVGFFLLLPLMVAADPALRNIAGFNNLNKDIKLDGYVYSSYNNLLRNSKFVTGALNREFDVEPSGLTLHQLAVTLSYQPKEGVGALIQPTIGRDTYAIAPYGWNPDYGSQTVGFAFQQAYLSYAKNNIVLNAGQLFALDGVESLNPMLNTNFSRGNLQSFTTPNTVFGGRATYKMHDKLHLTFGLNNGWDSIRDFNRQKTVEVSANFTVNKMFSFISTGYFGGQRVIDKVSSGAKGLRSVVDLESIINFNQDLTVITYYVYGHQSKAMLPNNNLNEAVWGGVGGYLNYKLNRKWHTSLRSEWFSDRDGFITRARQNWREVTLTLGYHLLKNVELRAEARADLSNKKAFQKSDSSGVSKYQRSYALEGIYDFILL